MEQRDLLKDQIEQLGRVLGKMLADFLGLKSESQISEAIEITNQRLQDELDIDVDKLTTLNKTELMDYLLDRKLKAEHLEILSEYMKEIGIEALKANKDNARIWLGKAIELIDIADETSRTMSFDRMNEKTRIENLLQQDI